jgi:hypothetical protein
MFYLLYLLASAFQYQSIHDTGQASLSPSVAAADAVWKKSKGGSVRLDGVNPWQPSWHAMQRQHIHPLSMTVVLHVALSTSYCVSLARSTAQNV